VKTPERERSGSGRTAVAKDERTRGNPCEFRRLAIKWINVSRFVKRLRSRTTLRSADVCLFLSSKVFFFKFCSVVIRWKLSYYNFALDHARFSFYFCRNSSTFLRLYCSLTETLLPFFVRRCVYTRVHIETSDENGNETKKDVRYTDYFIYIYIYAY